MKSGFVAILGRPNVGKSTLLNRLVGSKVSIVAHKPQTTRDAIQGVVTREEGQIVFVDSPGIHQPERELGRRMMREVQRAAAGCHLALLLVDATKPFRKGDDEAVKMLQKLGVPAILVLNKIDLLKSKQPLLPQIDRYRPLKAFRDFVPLSAKTGDNLELLLRLILENLPEAPPYYPEDFITDQPERFLAAELIRERVIEVTEQELPYSVAVVIESWEEEPPRRKGGPGLLRLSATIYVERPGQKGIIIGARGRTLKQIGTLAREEMEAWFGRKTYLELFVKVHPKWRDQRRFVDSLDFHEMLGGDSAATAPSAGPEPGGKTTI